MCCVSYSDHKLKLTQRKMGESTSGLLKRLCIGRRDVPVLVTYLSLAVAVPKNVAVPVFNICNSPANNTCIWQARASLDPFYWGKSPSELPLCPCKILSDSEDYHILN